MNNTKPLPLDQLELVINLTNTEYGSNKFYNYYLQKEIIPGSSSIYYIVVSYGRIGTSGVSYFAFGGRALERNKAIDKITQSSHQKCSRGYKEIKIGKQIKSKKLKSIKSTRLIFIDE